MFKILKKDNKTKARLGVLNTPHGKIETPSYVIVATHAQVKCLKPSDIKRTKTQAVIANTYHLWDRALKIARPSQLKLLRRSRQNSKLKIHGILGTKIPVMTDSGGFQVFSLGFGRENRIGKILKPVDNRLRKSVIHRRKNVKITDKGVYFKLDGRERFLGPKLSMQIQEKLGADIIFSFDECTSPFDSYNYNKKALERTHRWAKECLKAYQRTSRLRQSFGRRLDEVGLWPDKVGEPSQILFGIVQGGRFKNLRIKSAKFIGFLPFDGFGIGGSFGKDEMVETLKWVIPHLPEEKPRHLLGIGRIEDIFKAVENGIDLFDCVVPTREARHGRIWTARGHYDIRKIKYVNKNLPLEKGCKCPACKKITKAKLHELFKNPDKLAGQRYATIHNVWFFNNLLEEVRESIKNDKFKSFKKRFLKRFKS